MKQIAAAHAAVLAALHAAAFAAAEHWDVAAMAALLAMPGAFGFLDERGGFVLARAVGGEAEILTLAVAPAARRAGMGRALLGAVLDATAGLPVFLEVAASNDAARALYFTAGFAECGRRRGYYGPGCDAVVLKR